MKLIAVCLLTALTVAFLDSTDRPIKAERMTCFDSRNGSVFEFWTDTITNVNLAPSGQDVGFEVTTEAGEVRTLSKAQAAHLICVKEGAPV